MPDVRTWSCNCGAIRIEARGQPTQDWLVPLHHLPQGKRLAVHRKCHMARE